MSLILILVGTKGLRGSRYRVQALLSIVPFFSRFCLFASETSLLPSLAGLREKKETPTLLRVRI